MRFYFNTELLLEAINGLISFIVKTKKERKKGSNVIVIVGESKIRFCDFFQRHKTEQYCVHWREV